MIMCKNYCKKSNIFHATQINFPLLCHQLRYFYILGSVVSLRLILYMI